LLIAKQIERMKLRKITLPGHYRALGERLHGEGHYRDECPSIFQAIDAVLAEMDEIRARSEARPKAERLADRAKAVAVFVSEELARKRLWTRLNGICTELGRTVYEKHGEQSGATELVAPIINAQSRLAALDSDIRQLSESQPGQVLTPKRIAVAGMVVILVIVLELLLNGLSNGGSAGSVPKSSPSANGKAFEKPRQEDKWQADQDGPTSVEMPKTSQPKPKGPSFVPNGVTEVEKNIDGRRVLCIFRAHNGPRMVNARDLGRVTQQAVFEGDRLTMRKRQAEESGQYDEVQIQDQ
jgi:hypothetical protein